MATDAIPLASVAPGRVACWQPAAVSVDPWLVLRLTRFRRRDAVPPPIWEATVEMATRAQALAAPRALFRVQRVMGTGSTVVRLDAGPTFSGRAVSRLLEGCSFAVPFVLTLGPRLEAEVATLAERRELLEAFLLDTAGWAAIEVAIRGLRRALAARAREQGWRLTHRLGPGHGDWPLDEQQSLVALFDGAPPLIRLSEHGVLVPFKSISGIFGLRDASAERARGVPARRTTM